MFPYGTSIRAATAGSYPLIDDCIFDSHHRMHSECQDKPGIDAELFFTIAIRHNVTVELRRAYSSFSKNGDPNHKSVIEMLHNDDADISLEPLSLSLDRYEYNPHVSNAVLGQTYDLVARAAYSDELRMLVLRPFSDRIWLVILGLTFCTFAAIKLIKTFKGKCALAVLFSTAGVLANVLLNIYASILTVNLYATKKLELPFESIEDLSHEIATGRFTFVFESNNSNRFNILMRSEHWKESIPMYKRFLDSVERNPPKFVDSPGKAIETVLESTDRNYVFIEDSNACPVDRYCGLTAIRNVRMYSAPQVLYYSPKFKHRFPVDSSLETYYKLLVDKYCTDFRLRLNCSEETKDSRRRALKFIDIYGALVLIAIGSGLAMPAFCMEIIYARNSVRTKNTGTTGYPGHLQRAANSLPLSTRRWRFVSIKFCYTVDVAVQTI